MWHNYSEMIMEKNGKERVARVLINLKNSVGYFFIVIFLCLFDWIGEILNTYNLLTNDLTLNFYDISWVLLFLRIFQLWGWRNFHYLKTGPFGYPIFLKFFAWLTHKEIQFPNGPWFSGMKISSSHGLKNPPKSARGKKFLPPIRKLYIFC